MTAEHNEHEMESSHFFLNDQAMPTGLSKTEAMLLATVMDAVKAYNQLSDKKHIDLQFSDKQNILRNDVSQAIETRKKQHNFKLTSQKNNAEPCIADEEAIAALSEALSLNDTSAKDHQE